MKPAPSTAAASQPFVPSARKHGKLLTREQRRKKSAERRAKQRSENVERAKSMHAARLKWEKINKTKSRATDSALPRVNVGCSGWFYWHWRGGFYPAGMPTNKWFAHYADHFRTVELNAPFYSWPTVSAVRGWIRQAARRKFIYTVKVSELITHVKRFSGTKMLIRDFGYIADLLGSRMGCFLFQLPPSFHFTRSRLRRILSQIDPARRNVIEFRHRSWWNEEVYTAFRAHGTIFCSSSAPGLPNQLVESGHEIYIRFHGLRQWYRHDYSAKELAAWAERVEASGVERVWAYFNNDRNGYAIKNARALWRRIR